jgi:hypothetical protein
MEGRTPHLEGACVTMVPRLEEHMGNQKLSGAGDDRWVDRAAKFFAPDGDNDLSAGGVSNRRTFLGRFTKLLGGVALIAGAARLSSDSTEALEEAPLTHTCATGCTRVYNFGCDACVDFETRGYLCTCEFCRDTGELCGVYDCDYTGYDPICS